MPLPEAVLQAFPDDSSIVGVLEDATAMAFVENGFDLLSRFALISLAKFISSRIAAEAVQLVTDSGQIIQHVSRQ